MPLIVPGVVLGTAMYVYNVELENRLDMDVLLQLAQAAAPEASRHGRTLGARILGMQACLWSENLHDRWLVDHMIFPRMPAMAETAWTPRDRKSWSRFAAIAPLLYGAGEKVGN